MSSVRVRFAPSPTGELHVGGLRTALFNYLYARQNGGQFILRIEDTDQERLVEGAEQGILEMLTWAGVAPDEGPHTGGAAGPYRQSERLPQYHAAAEKLIGMGRAYKCYVSPAELDQMRAEQTARGQPPKYDGRHRHLTDADRARFEAEGRKPVVRMHIPDKDERVVVDDLVRGKVAFNTAQLDDQVLLKSDGFPTYHLAVVTDDHAMGITHVLRAEEWLPSTPKHILLYKWLDLPLPRFAHLPLLLNDDRSKMSKRKGDVAAEAYRAKGYLPEALVNFLSLLGWNPGDDRELFSVAELVEHFSIERITKAGAVFDRDKLNWMNQTYLQKLEVERLIELTAPYLAAGPYAGANPEFLKQVLPIVQPAMVLLADVNENLAVFFRDTSEGVEAPIREALAEEGARTVLEAFRERLADAEGLDPAGFKALTKEVQKATGIKGRGLFHPLRLAITLSEQGPDLADVATVFGKDKTVQRLEQALAGYPA